MTVALADALGRTVRTLDLGARAAGEHRTEVVLDGLAAGIYTVRVSDGERTATRSLTVVR